MTNNPPSIEPKSLATAASLCMRILQCDHGICNSQNNRLKLKITIFFSSLMLPNFWKSITFDDRNPTFRPLFPLCKRKKQIIKTLPIINALQFPKDHLLWLLLLLLLLSSSSSLLLDGSQASLVCPLVKTKMNTSMNIGSTMMTKETKYSEKNLALEQSNALHSSSQLQLTEGQRVKSGGLLTKRDAIYEISEHQEKETLSLFELMLIIHNNSVLSSQKTVPAYYTNKTGQYCI